MQFVSKKGSNLFNKKLRLILLAFAFLFSIQCFGQDIQGELTEAFSLRKNSVQVREFFERKGFKKTQEKDGILTLKKDEDRVLVVFKKGRIAAIDYETKDTTQFASWIKDMSKVELGSRNMYSAIQDRLYFIADLKNNIAILSIASLDD